MQTRPGFLGAYSDALRPRTDIEDSVNGVGEHCDRVFAFLEPIGTDVNSSDGDNEWQQRNTQTGNIAIVQSPAGSVRSVEPQPDTLVTD